MNYSGEKDIPAITIGMPVYNGAESLRSALDSLINQTFKNFELIISDNASTDSTAEICETYANKDVRIKYIRQTSNIGVVGNFKYVLMAASADYFMWAAADDVRSLDYLELNYEFLLNNSTYVASTSPNGFESWKSDKELVSFSIEEDEVFDRYIKFFQNCYNSHGLFYGLIRTNVMRDSRLLDQIFPNYDWLGMDWATILYLASIGKLNRTMKGHTVFGVQGASSNSNIFRIFNTHWIEYFMPFYVLSKFAITLTKELPHRQKLKMLYVLVKLNISAVVGPLQKSQKAFFNRMYHGFLKRLMNTFLYRVYCRFLKPLVKNI